MGWPRNLVMVRHAESEGNVLTADERAEYDCATDRYRLTERGRKQAELTARFLYKRYPEGFAAYYTSYYVRSRETMEIMYPKAKIYEDPRLAEATRGIWHTMSAAQMEARFPEEVKRKEREGLYHYRPLGGENWPDIELRIHSFLGTLSRDYEGRDVLMVVHGHWLILLQRLIHHFSIEEAVRLYKQGHFHNASVTSYWVDRDTAGRQRFVCDLNNYAPWKEELKD